MYRASTSLLSERLTEASRTHWGEFAALIAGASAPGALAAILGAFKAGADSQARALILVLAIVCLISAVVSYYGILNGTLLSVAPLGPLQISASLVISGGQIGSVLLIVGVATAQDEYQNALDCILALRHFLLLQAMLAAGAAAANFFAARDRRFWSDLLERTLKPSPQVLAEFNRLQSYESLAASIAAVGLTLAWITSLIRPDMWFLIIMAGLDGLAMVSAVALQRRGHLQLWRRQLAGRDDLRQTSSVLQ